MFYFFSHIFVNYLHIKVKEFLCCECWIIDIVLLFWIKRQCRGLIKLGFFKPRNNIWAISHWILCFWKFFRTHIYARWWAPTLGNAVRDWLNSNLQQRWSGRGVEDNNIPRPARLPDLTPWIFFYRGSSKARFISKIMKILTAWKLQLQQHSRKFQEK